MKKQGAISVFQKKEEKKSKSGPYKWLAIAVIIFIIGYIVMSGLKIMRLNEEKKEVEKQYQDLVHKKEVLMKEYSNISSDEYIEMLARRDLKLVKPNELLFILPDEIGDTKAGEDVKAGESKEEDGKTEDGKTKSGQIKN